MSPDLAEFNQSAMWTTDERAAQLHRELARDIVSASCLRASASTSDRGGRPWFEPALFVGRPTILRRIGALLALRMQENVDRLVTASTPGVALAASASLACGVPFSVFPSPAAAAVDGQGEPWTRELHAGDAVVLIEDVVDTGRHALGAVEQIDGLGGRVVGVLSVIDLEGEGARLLSSAAYPYDALFRLADLRPC